MPSLGQVALWTATPFFRTAEETAALEGLMTAALSQLESIVCRVVYCPGSSDPLSTLVARKQQHRCHHQRLTPNSRNIHQQWIPLAPGLGCGGLFYLDASQDLLLPLSSSSSTKDRASTRATQHQQQPSDSSSKLNHNHSGKRGLASASHTI